MSEWKQKRFWTDVTVVQAPQGWTVHLDGRGVKTPAKAPLVVPSKALAEAMALEWAAQVDLVDPKTMPVTRGANAAIDKVAAQHHEVAEMLAAYGDNDLLCYRAEGPESLVAQQVRVWDPLLDWAETTYGARLVLVEGVMPKPQPAEALSRLGAPLFAATNFELAALHDLVAMSGSLVIGLAAARSAFDIDSLWQASRLDETWQEQQWGVDDEATELSEIKRTAFKNAQRFFLMAQTMP